MSRDLIFLAVSMMAWGLGEGMFFLFQPLYLEELGASPMDIGGILSAVGIAMTVAHIPAGFLADRIGRRPMIWLAWGTGMVSAWVMALASSLPVFVTGMILYGLTAFVMSPLNSYITEARGKLSVGRAITLISAFYNTGAILGPWLGGQIGSQLGLHAVYKVSAGIFIISMLIVLLIRPQPVVHHERSSQHARFPLNRGYLVFIGIVFLAMFAAYLPQPLSPNFLQNERQVSVEQIGELGSIGGIGIVFLNLVLGSLNARLGFIVGQACMAGYSLALWQGTGMGWYAISYFLIGGYRVTRSFATAQTRDLVPPSWMGLAYGITETMSASATIFAPLLAGILYEQNPSLIYAAALALLGLSIVVSLYFVLARRKQPAAAVQA